MSQVTQVSQTGWQVFVEVPGKAPIELPPGESVVGRSRACAVQIAETTVSRQHAIFVVEPGRVKLRDLGSSNGTFVNGQRVDGEMALADGDRVVVGEAELVLRMLAPLGPAEATARLVIPPLSALPAAPAVPPRAPSPEAAPAWAAAPLPELPGSSPRIGPASGARAASTPSTPAWAPTTSSRNPAHPVFPPSFPPSSPARSDAPARSASTSPPTAVAPGAPAVPSNKSPEMLSSLRDFDLAPLPPSLPRQAAVGEKVEPAGFWLRVAASLLDSIPMALILAAYVVMLFFVLRQVASVITFLAMAAYYLLVFLILPALKGTTPGKRILKLSIVSETTAPGQGLGWGTAALRLVGYLVCSLTFGLGYLLVAFSARKQGLHDLIAKTNVVRKR